MQKDAIGDDEDDGLELVQMSMHDKKLYKKTPREVRRRYI
jgi:hypothetical protein